MNEYEKINVQKADISEAVDILEIIKKRCKWLEENNINQWNITKTYGEQYYISKIQEEKIYIAKLGNKIVRDFYATV